MNNYENEVWILITRVLSGEAGPGEIEEIRQWVEEDRKHAELFNELRSAWRENPDNESVDAAFLFDYKSGRNKLREKLRRKKKKRIVASPTLPVHTRKKSIWKIAASVLVLIIPAAFAVYFGMQYWSPPIKTYRTTNIEQRIITLPDGSNVRLNRNSSIRFAAGLTGQTRELNLKGEAFFKVKFDADRPFIVHAGNAIIRDIGTAFNVKEEKKGPLLVAVKEGIVSLRDSNKSSKKATILKKDKIGKLTKAGVLITEEVDIANYLSWINGQLVFKDMSLKQVARQLENIYSIDCKFQTPSLSTLTLTAYTKELALDEVLDMIAFSLELDYKKKGNTIIWMNKTNN